MTILTHEQVARQGGPVNVYEGILNGDRRAVRTSEIGPAAMFFGGLVVVGLTFLLVNKHGQSAPVTPPAAPAATVAAPAPAAPSVTPPSVAAAPAPAPVKLYFATAKADLPANATQALAPVVAWAKDHAASKVVISGFHDASGSLASNQALAKRRAQATAAALGVAGLEAARIVLEKPALTEGKGAPEEARRVEVSIRG